MKLAPALLQYCQGGTVLATSSLLYHQMSYDELMMKAQYQQLSTEEEADLKYHIEALHSYSMPLSKASLLVILFAFVGMCFLITWLVCT